MASKKSMESQCVQRALEEVKHDLHVEGIVVPRYAGNAFRRLDYLYGKVRCGGCKKKVWTSYECTLEYDFKKGRCIRKYGQQCAKCPCSTYWRPMLDEDELLERMKKQIRRALTNEVPTKKHPRPQHGGPHHRVDLCELCSGVPNHGGDGSD